MVAEIEFALLEELLGPAEKFDNDPAVRGWVWGEMPSSGYLYKVWIDCQGDPEGWRLCDPELDQRKEGLTFDQLLTIITDPQWRRKNWFLPLEGDIL